MMAGYAEEPAFKGHRIVVACEHARHPHKDFAAGVLRALRRAQQVPAKALHPPRKTAVQLSHSLLIAPAGQPQDRLQVQCLHPAPLAAALFEPHCVIRPCRREISGICAAGKTATIRRLGGRGMQVAQLTTSQQEEAIWEGGRKSDLYTRRRKVAQVRQARNGIIEHTGPICRWDCTFPSPSAAPSAATATLLRGCFRGPCIAATWNACARR